MQYAAPVAPSATAECIFRRLRLLYPPLAESCGDTFGGTWIGTQTGATRTAASFTAWNAGLVSPVPDSTPPSPLSELA